MCLHCGGRTGEPRFPVALAETPRFGPPSDEDGPRLDPEVPDEVPDEMPADDEAVSVRRSVLGTIMNVLWVALLVGGYLFHSCGQGSE